MAITFTNDKLFKTTSNSAIWFQQAAASVSFFFRYEATGDPSNGVIHHLDVVSRGNDYSLRCYLMPVDSQNIGLRCATFDSTGTGYYLTQNFEVGLTYHVAITHANGVQKYYVNGAPYTLGSFSGNTQGGAAAFILGGTPPGSPCVYTIDDLRIWNGYTLTAADVVNVRDRNPLTTDGGASLRCLWTLAGTSGNTVQLGDPGLIESYGNSAYNLGLTSGTGSAVYTNSLSFVPTVKVASAYVGTSGKTVFVFLASKQGGQTAFCTGVNSYPTISKNGTNLGVLTDLWATGYHKCASFRLPAGQVIGPNDTVTLSAPSTWAITNVGLSEAITNLPIDNFTGRSALGTDAAPRTLKMGLNFSALGSDSGTNYQLFRNWRYRVTSWSGVSNLTLDGKPLALAGTAATARVFTASALPSGIDSTNSPGSTGLYAVVWDDLDLAHPTNFNLETDTSATTTVTERLDLANPGDAKGKGKARVFDIQHAAGATKANLEILMRVTAMNGIPNFDNLWIVGPGDFSTTPNTPVTIDRSDPLAPSSVFLDRVKYGCASARGVDAILGYAGTSTQSDPEDIRKLTDFSWSAGTFKKPYMDVVCAQVRPFLASPTSYIYSSLFGTPYNATLANDITDTTSTSITISDAATAPVLPGQYLVMDSETLRVLSVNGTTVTVERGALKSQAATHRAGAITVKYRTAITSFMSTWRVFEVVTANQHDLRTGQSYLFNSSTSWSSLKFADNSTLSMSGLSAVVYVTGLNTFILIQPGTNAPALSQTYTLTSDATFRQRRPEGPGIPYGAFARLLGNTPGCDFHLNFPAVGTDSLVDAVAADVLANFPPGRKVFIELSNETWNVAFSQQWFFGAMNNILYPGGFGREVYTLRACQVADRFRARFAEAGRGNEIVPLLGIWLLASGTSTASALNFAQSNGYSFGAVAASVYVSPEANSSITDATKNAFTAYDDEQAIDLYIHDLYYNTKSGANYADWLTTQNQAVQAYNATYGKQCMLYAYECGLELSMPPVYTTLTAAIDAVTQTIPIASAAGFAPGVWALMGTEWVVVTAVTGNTLTVNRAQGGSTAAARTSGSQIRNWNLERMRDLAYNPNWRILEQDMYAFFQRYGLQRANIYSYSIYYSGYPNWGQYHWPHQPYGMGDGSDGKADNRLTLARPGQVYSKAPGVNQDQMNVSVRGQAFQDWQKIAYRKKRRLSLPFSRLGNR